ncbi:MAG: endonuclease MutS2 [Calditrichia bacterium]
MEKQIQHLTNNENFQQLEVSALLEKVRTLIKTVYGHPFLDKIRLLSTKSEIENKLQEVSEMTDLLQGGYDIPFSQLDDIRPLLNRLKPEDSFLEAAELNQVKGNLHLFGEVSRTILFHQENCPHLTMYANRIHPHQSIAREIEKTINEHHEIREETSPELRRIRNEMRHLENQQKTMLGKIIKRYAEFSQDDIVTLRDGRMVLGIQQHYINQVNGIVHGTSGTGATVFIEPMETLKISNQIQNLKIEERNEVIRILKFLSGLIREVRNDLFYTMENMGLLDFIHAKALLSRQLDADRPKITEKPLLKLINARHPLLLLKMGHQHVVPANVTLGEDFYTLVITGPNAGGKTVTLKTIGMLIIMARLGFHISAHPDSVIPILDDVLVDIGDRQSLEQDLSTFSAHILRLREILRQASTHTLILIDEVGTGTDPREGSALATAILKELTERKALTIATTHHGELKAFAFASDNVENASMEFNMETLQPTYKLRVGIPGSSYAFEIARRYGFPDLVLESARGILGPDVGRLEQLILDLNERLQQADLDRRQLSIKLSEAEGLRNLYERNMERLHREEKEYRRKAAEEAEKILEGANAKIEHSVAEIRRLQGSKDSIRQAHETVDQLKKSVNRVLKETRPRFEKRNDPLQQGDVVWSETLRQEGEMLSEPDSNGKAWVQMGDLRMQLEVKTLKKVAGKKTTARVYKSSSLPKDQMAKGELPELDLRGMDSFEAVEATNLYLDRASGEGWTEVRIIHGKGTGTLRQRINQFLSGDSRVEEKRLGRWGEGDTGVTVVRLRK